MRLVVVDLVIAWNISYGKRGMGELARKAAIRRGDTPPAMPS